MRCALQNYPNQARKPDFAYPAENPHRSSSADQAISPTDFSVAL
jgi:hypothetical protein